MIYSLIDPKQRSLRVTLLALFTVLPSLSAHALTEIDINDPMGGSTLISAAVLDETTELVYLKTRFTTGLTFDDIQGGEGGWIDDGWSIATTQETCSLIANAGSTNCPGRTTATQPDFDPTEIVELLGENGDQGQDRIFAVFDDSDQGSSEPVGVMDLSAGSAPAATVSLDFTSSSVVFGGPTGSVLLVQPVPEPAASMSIALGTLMLSALSAKRHRG